MEQAFDTLLEIITDMQWEGVGWPLHGAGGLSRQSTLAPAKQHSG